MSTTQNTSRQPVPFGTSLRSGETAHGVTYEGPADSEIAFTAPTADAATPACIFQFFLHGTRAGSVTFHASPEQCVPCAITIDGRTYSQYMNDEGEVKPLVFQHQSFVRLIADAWPLEMPFFGTINGPLS
jgi:hypothetical protein